MNNLNLGQALEIIKKADISEEFRAELLVYGEQLENQPAAVEKLKSFIVKAVAESSSQLAAAMLDDFQAQENILPVIDKL